MFMVSLRSVIDIVILICVRLCVPSRGVARPTHRRQFVTMPDNLVYLALFDFINNRKSKALFHPRL